MKLHTLFATSALAIVGLACTAALTPAAAQGTQTPHVDQRQANQQARIAQGAASGALTGREQLRLQREQNAIARAEAAAKADGVVTTHERRVLHRAQDVASRDIARQKHDHQRAPGKP